MADDRTIEPMTPESDPIATARRQHGVAGAVLAAGMFGVDIALGRPPKEEAPIVVASPTDPTDIDTDGIRVPVDDRTEVWSVLPTTASSSTDRA